MFWFIKQGFISLLSFFSESLATKCMSLNTEPCIARRTFIDLNPIELNYYPFMISLDKCNERCNVADHLSTKICVSSEKKDVNAEVFSTIISINEEKRSVKHISCDCKCKFISTSCSSNQKWNSDKYKY